jgi:hypothetical protein
MASLQTSSHTDINIEENNRKKMRKRINVDFYGASQTIIIYLFVFSSSFVVSFTNVSIGSNGWLDHV